MAVLSGQGHGGGKTEHTCKLKLHVLLSMLDMRKSRKDKHAEIVTLFESLVNEK